MAETTPWYVLISGSSRGIGWGLVHQFINKTSATVIATCRDPASASLLREIQKDLGEHQERLILLPLDISKEESIQHLFDELQARGIKAIDILIANAGISNRGHPSDPILSTNTEDMMRVYRTNVVGNLHLLQTFHSMLMASTMKIALVMSSSRGSFTNAADVGDQTSYRVSKAGLNMLGILYAVDTEVRDNGIKVILMHPGWVQTDMGLVGGQPAETDIETSTAGILSILERTAVLQLQKFGNLPAEEIDQHFRFSAPLEENEKRENLNDFVERLYEENFAYVRYDGIIMNW